MFSDHLKHDASSIPTILTLIRDAFKSHCHWYVNSVPISESTHRKTTCKAEGVQKSNTSETYVVTTPLQSSSRKCSRNCAVEESLLQVACPFHKYDPPNYDRRTSGTDKKYQTCVSPSVPVNRLNLLK